jgi:Cu-Zn family superoxide dismutase
MNRAELTLVALLLAPLAACAGSTADRSAPTPPPAAPAATAPPAADVPAATATLEGRSGSTLTGSARFTSDGATVTLTLQVEGAPPGSHAVHLHETGDCSAPDASSAGAHWNPTREDHGQWGHAPHHLGDIGNLSVGTDGTGTLVLTTDRWSVGTGDTGDLLGRAVIVHEKPDDFATQPTGAAGGRIGCGVVRR